MTVCFLAANLFTQQISINRVEMMPNMPGTYEMRDWKPVAIGCDSFIANQAYAPNFHHIPDSDFLPHPEERKKETKPVMQN